MSAELEYRNNVKLYDICKWILEYIRNIAIVITIGVAYKLSNSTGLLILSTVGSGALIVMALTQVNKIIYKSSFMDGMPRLLQIITALFLICLLLLFVNRINKLVEETIEFQYKIQNSKTYLKSQMPCRFTLDLSGYACVQ